MTLGEKIGYFAKQKNISLRRLALESGINYNSLYAFVKRGGERLPDESIENIANVLEIKKKTLISEELVVDRKEVNLTEAEAKLQATISSIVGLSTGKEREEKLYLINTFLETNAGLIKEVYALSQRKQRSRKV